MLRSTLFLGLLASTVASQEHVLPAPGFSSGEIVRGMDAGFLNGDRHVDTVFLQGEELGVMLGTPARGFSPASFTDPLTGSDELRSVFVTEADGDGVLDLIVSAGSDLALLRGNGDGTFTTVWEESLDLDPQGAQTTSLSRVTAGDLDGDGRLDIVGVSDEWNALVWRDAADPPAFRGEVALPGEPTGVQCCDVDGDRLGDVVVSHTNPDGITVFYSPFVTGGTTSVVHLATEAGPRNLQLGFFNVDPHPDIIVANGSSDSFTIHTGSPSGFLGAQSLPTGAEPLTTLFEDLDGDGHTDVATLGIDGLHLHRNDGAGGLLAPESILLSHISGDLRFLDVDRDGHRDALFLAGDTGPGYLISDRQGGFLELGGSVRVGSGWRELLPLDLNSDGNADLISINTGAGNGVRALVGDGLGGFNPLLPVQLTSTPTRLAAGDVDSDGNPDVVLTSFQNGTLTLLGTDGNGGFAAPIDLTSQVEPDGLALADLDLDGVLDVAFASRPGLVVHLGDGIGGFQPGVTASSGHYRRLVSEDFDANGIPDLAVSREVNTSVVALTNLGDGITYLEQRHSIPTPLIGLAAADGDADGAVDLFVLHSPGTRTSLRRLWNDGSGLFGNSDVVRVPYDAAGQIQFGDLNADGLLDLILPSDSPSAVAVHHGLGGRDFQDPILHGGMGLRSELEDGERNERVALADLDGDGRLDVAFEEGSAQADLCLLLNRIEDAPRTARYGAGTGGCVGTQTLATHGAPDLGNADFAITGANAPANVDGFLALSFGSDTTGTLLPGLGLVLHVDTHQGQLFLQRTRSDASGAIHVPIAIPDDAALDGLNLYAQTFFRWPQPGPCQSSINGWSSSEGLELVIGPAQ